ncbi:hypothetical protein [Rhodobacter capsulatus]|jgi:hypothetical protein|uniref:Gamma-glutamyl kinase n=1 Tax=Rhodobacter capsulatus (strain ATCC BAA-309 / NBRC 16581 / SB1003) TaxID=272942 RepID=D5ATC4_RHOCB|nr:hypothetical protein [Rhodobacter capsulatus]ADE85231.1 conserved hypothetical protein [Rhodobacter capsulatus SB 1003]ETD01958.1 gamma-glutamyl kinase [Rhodobacter capsulatus DE442]ETD76998.1 gamma-glutamyl kinase [Rhodobacter capsulatus R121]ETD84860.1 gamma-glutamyl kinase [Rhodobacter capsulatus B6]ETE53958.1 gamma-glutamyl kinase [Rhodobacter capsulatus Y262]
MMVFPRENLVFFAVPKTGTTAIEAALDARAAIVLRDPPQMKHMTVASYARSLQPLLKADYEMMAVIRHPLDWHGSHYRYRSRPALKGTARSTAEQSFADFITRMLTPGNAEADGSQSRFLSLRDGSCPVRHLFRYEAQDRILAFLAERFGGPVALPVVNVSPRRALDLPAALRMAHETRFARCYEMWETAQH